MMGIVKNLMVIAVSISMLIIVSACGGGGGGGGETVVGLATADNTQLLDE